MAAPVELERSRFNLRNIMGAFVASTASGAGIAYVRRQGADQVIDYESEHFEDILKDFDAVLDTVGGEIYKKSFQVAKRSGSLFPCSLCPTRTHEKIPCQGCA